MTHGKREATEGFVGGKKPIKHCVSRSQTSAQGNQHPPGLVHTGPVLGLGNGKGVEEDKDPISREQTIFTV